MSHQLQILLAELKTRLRDIYKGRLRGLYLFGSYARGQEDKESDLDVLVVLDDFKRYGKEVDHTSELTSKLSLQYGISISKVFLREQDWLNGKTPFLANVREEAIPA